MEEEAKFNVSSHGHQTVCYYGTVKFILQNLTVQEKDLWDEKLSRRKCAQYVEFMNLKLLSAWNQSCCLRNVSSHIKNELQWVLKSHYQKDNSALDLQITEGTSLFDVCGPCDVLQYYVRLVPMQEYAPFSWSVGVRVVDKHDGLSCKRAKFGSWRAVLQNRVSSSLVYFALTASLVDRASRPMKWSQRVCFIPEILSWAARGDCNKKVWSSVLEKWSYFPHWFIRSSSLWAYGLNL